MDLQGRCQIRVERAAPASLKQTSLILANRAALRPGVNEAQ
jgi:hypothetical protein